MDERDTIKIKDIVVARCNYIAKTISYDQCAHGSRTVLGLVIISMFNFYLLPGNFHERIRL